MIMRSGNLILGFDNVKTQIMNNNIYLILVCADLSDKTVKEIKFVSSKGNIPIHRIGLSINDVHFLIGKKAGVLGVSDKKFSVNLIEKLGSTDGFIN